MHALPSKHDVIHKTGSTQRITTLPENRATATGDLHKKFVKTGPAVPEICLQTDRHTQTDGQTDRNTPLPNQQPTCLLLVSAQGKWPKVSH